MRRDVLIGTFGVALLIGAVFGVALLRPEPMRANVLTKTEQLLTSQIPTSVATSTTDAIIGPMGTVEMMDAAFAAKEPWTVASGTRVLILPHHLVASREIASLVSAVQKPSIVYLISPDHFSQGKTVFTTTDASFQTPYGMINDSSDDGATRRAVPLQDAVPRMKNDRTPFLKEHGVSNLLPFFARVWPGTPVVPVIVRIDASQQDRSNLADALTRRLSEDSHALLVSTVDFSHYQPAEVADFHDELAQDVVTSLSDLETDRVEIDSPGALAVGLRVARSLGLGDVTIHAHTNSLRILQAKIAQDSTSHFLVSFAPGEIKKQEELSMLFVGDMMLDRTVGTRIKKAGTFEYPFQQIRGAEDRFFRGQDALIGNLEGPVATRVSSTKAISFAFSSQVVGVLKKMGFDAVSQANNHSRDQGIQGASVSRAAINAGGIVAFGDEVRDDATSSLAILERRGRKIALLGFNVTESPLDKTLAEKSIAQAKQHADVVVVFMHWGMEYHDTPTQVQTDLAHWFIDRGVDAVIGSHPHWMQSVEVYHNKIIAYSLGNFIFDQDWSTETNFGLTVGLSITGQKTELYLYPIKIEKSQPRLLTGAERDARLNKLAKISDPALKDQILSGVVRSQ